MSLNWEDFEKTDMRVGTILEAVMAEGLKKPAIRLLIDFGPLGIKPSSAQITDHYTPDMLIGKQVIAVVNFPPKQIGKFISACLVLGAVNDEGKVTLLQPERPCDNGCRIA
jgi:tRNA-binding protein